MYHVSKSTFAQVVVMNIVDGFTMVWIIQWRATVYIYINFILLPSPYNDYGGRWPIFLTYCFVKS
jgi:hypothetical protein